MNIKEEWNESSRKYIVNMYYYPLELDEEKYRELWFKYIGWSKSRFVLSKYE